MSNTSGTNVSLRSLSLFVHGKCSLFFSSFCHSEMVLRIVHVLQILLIIVLHRVLLSKKLTLWFGHNHILKVIGLELCRYKYASVVACLVAMPRVVFCAPDQTEYQYINLVEVVDHLKKQTSLNTNRQASSKPWFKLILKLLQTFWYSWTWSGSLFKGFRVQKSSEQERWM